MSKSNNTGFTKRIAISTKKYTEGQIAFLLYQGILKEDQLQKLADGKEVYVNMSSHFKANFAKEWLAEVAHFTDDDTYCLLTEEDAKKRKFERVICWVQPDGVIEVDPDLSRDDRRDYQTALKKWRSVKPTAQPVDPNKGETAAAEAETSGDGKPATPPAVKPGTDGFRPLNATPLSYHNVPLHVPMTEQDKKALSAANAALWQERFASKTPAERLVCIAALENDLTEAKKVNEALVVAEKKAAEEAAKAPAAVPVGANATLDGMRQMIMASWSSMDEAARASAMQTLSSMEALYAKTIIK